MCFIYVYKTKSIVTTQKSTYERVSEIVNCPHERSLAVFRFKTLSYDLNVIKHIYKQELDLNRMNNVNIDEQFKKYLRVQRFFKITVTK